MSSFADLMERGDSDQSVLSRRGSEIGSHYQVESGLYMTSFAATIFLAALVTVGVLLITLLITLTVMLQSCQSKSTGVVQLEKLNVEFDYCKVFVLHAELNGMVVDEVPTVCKAYITQYIKEGQYHRELQLTMQLAESYLSALVPNDDGLDVVLMDIDDIFSANFLHQNKLLYYRDELTEEVKHRIHIFLLGLHTTLRNSGWSMILFTRRHEKQRNATIERLISAGYGGWSTLIMRSDHELRMESWEYISKRRVALHNQGFRITSVISSQMDALTGPCLGKQNFKFSNPTYYLIAQSITGF
ncbi:hypothetical protein MRB53_025173 [Persea americana]|uniref:Uncharacterized protein n=1 Tax=Persea americana TaxID=3435 RepID=A0ACC2LF12_PERAE|nr:hypothetical protein MRB53_025173 [Persea americana]|eukprot:TRINITY_DN2749_c0_g2_i1.p1 TRINITY_DN2749_c0_g2~~TRINITY_DN2749_c0_g2_i1.p1  ORF type:complete len:301 (-),score=41.19 TRINITY_DN2749_c0_g2_i1:159-1061(-)